MFYFRYNGILQCMRERPVPYIMEHDGNLRCFRFFVSNSMSFGTQNFYGLRHQVHGSQGMMKACMMRSRVYQMRHAKLADSSEPLKVRMFNNGLDEFALYSNETINWVVKKKRFGHKMFLK